MRKLKILAIASVLFVAEWAVIISGCKKESPVEGVWHNTPRVVAPVAVPEVCYEPEAECYNPEPEEVDVHDKLVDLICKYESFKPTAYRCPAGKLTIGYGFTAKKYLAMGSMTEPQARAILVNEVIPQTRALVRKYVKYNLTEYQEAALISFTFNVGEGNLVKLVSGSRLKNGEVPNYMKLYTKAKVSGKMKELGGLVKRRNDEAKLFRGESLMQAYASANM